MTIWNPWRGCHKCSEGCKFCYIHKGDKKRGVNTDEIVKTDKFCLPLEKYIKGKNKDRYKIKTGELVYVCFSSDFFIKEADEWRTECFKMIKERSDVNFLFLTKRIDRFYDCIPEDWGQGYNNIIIGCTVENQEMADYKLSIFDKLPIKHKNIILQPLLENVDISKHLTNTELVVVGGESDYNARPLNYDWVLNIRDQCLAAKVHFEFRQCGTYFIKDGIKYTLNVRQLCSQAKKADINF